MDDKSFKKPLISVIIPTFNEGPTLGIAIDSIIHQTYENLEIIIVDDGSTDDTKEIVAEFIKKDARVRYLECPLKDPKRNDFRGVNISVGYLARNFAMQESKGEWITFQDADDASLVNRIEIQLQLATQHNAVCVTTSWIKFDENYLNKKLNLEKFIQDNNIPEITILPEVISAQAKKIKGLLMHPWFPHQYVPFIFKKRIPTRLLFLGSTTAYPGADSAPFFKRETISKVLFRKRDDRVWPSASGRGVGRDHLFQLAEVYGRNYSFKIPLYLWRQKHENLDFKNIEKYLI